MLFKPNPVLRRAEVTYSYTSDERPDSPTYGKTYMLRKDPTAAQNAGRGGEGGGAGGGARVVLRSLFRRFTVERIEECEKSRFHA